MTDQNAADLISVPTGGGALSGIGETFQPDPHTGTGNLTIPLDLPAGRNGLRPSLSLSYSTGHPNGPFGLGWSLPVPGVRRQTEKGIPRYRPGLDTFVLSGAEDLVPVAGLDTDAVRYRPGSEAGYARITHRTGAGGDYWEVWSTDGLRSRYGTAAPPGRSPGWADPAVIADPAEPSRIFAWLLTETADPLGNTISYTYQADQAGTAQRYLSQISYADYGDQASPRYLVTVTIVLDPDPRPDPFSDHRPGFELRTTQRVAAIETRTQAGTPMLARRVGLSYADQAGPPPASMVSLLTRITVTGIDGESTQALPPLEFGYTEWDPAARRYQPFTVAAAGLPVASLAGPGLDLVDLFGDGLPSILQLNGVARYWRNRGDGSFDPPRKLPYAPEGVNLGAPGVQLADFDGDGRPDLLFSTPDRTGYWPLASNGGFDPAGYIPVSPAPAVSLADPLVRLIDLDGDGITDALRTGDRFELFYSDSGASFSQVQVLPRGGDVPDVTFGDPRVFLADMTGDGLTDIVLVHDGNITYWPNQGYGSWGAKVVMHSPPRFADSGAYPGTGFDPRRLLLGDIDGDGCADAVYVGDATVTVWVNQAGNGFAAPVTIRGTPQAAGASMRLADMAGTGTSGVLWTYDPGTARGSSYKFLDLTGGTKPYLLCSVDNHCGAATAIAYSTSTAYAVADRAAGKPWRTTLPFPVHVVASTTVTDYFSQTSLTSEYRYHHGYWDGGDREFRGFAQVEQRDTFTPAAAVPESYSPPTQTRSWFHLGPVGPRTGAWSEGLDLSAEYWPDDPLLTGHVDTSALPAGMNRGGLRAAIRALRGRLLRSELYALDGDPGASRPCQVSDQAYALAPVLDGRQASDPGWQAAPVVAVQPVLDRSSEWERGTDPMTKATVTGGYDDYGRPHQRVQVAVPRGRDPHLTSPAGIGPYLATMTLTDYATRDDATHYLVSRVSREQRLELTEDTTTAGAGLAAFARQQLAAPPAPTAGNIRALTLHYFDGPAFDGLPLGELGDWGLPTRVESLALTPAILAAAYQGDDPSPPYLDHSAVTWTGDYPQAFRDLIAPLAGYRYQRDQAPYLAGWYVQQARVAYDVQQPGGGRGLVVARRDQLGNDTTIAYDTYELLPASVTDPGELTLRAEYDYRVLRPSLVTDPNGNQAAVGYTPLALPAWTASTGKPGAAEGDTRAQPSTVFSYDLTAWDDNPADRQPGSVRTIRRVDSAWTLISAEAQRLGRPLTADEVAALFPPDEISAYPGRFIQKADFSDGFGRLLQSRGQGDDIILDDLGLTADMSAAGGPAVTRRPDQAAPPPVIVTGWQAYDNKGRVIAKYEPFFATGWAYQPPTDDQLTKLLAKVVTVYDPRGLAVRTIYPDGSEQRLVPGVPSDLADPDRFAPTPWEIYRYDNNDNAGRTHPGRSASWSAHWNTPASDLLDPLERVIEHTERTATAALVSRTAYDIDGRPLQVTDPLGRGASLQVYDLQGRSWRHQLIDAGTIRVVRDAAGRTVEQRDSKGALRLKAFDALGRPLRTWARDRDDGGLTLREAFVYGDNAAETGLSASDAAAANLLGRAYHTYDEAGRAETTRYDPEGNLLEKTRRTLATPVVMSALPGPAGDWADAAYQADWQPAAGQTLDQRASPLLDTSAYTVSTRYDALGRPVAVTAPLDADGNRQAQHLTYNRAGALTALDLDGDVYIEQILYDPRGRRTLAILGSGVMIRYVYDPQTSRLARLRSEAAAVAPSRGSAAPAIQDYGYVYDLAGNLLTVRDRTPGSGIAPAPDQLDRDFTYDPLYQLTSATGRECDIPPPAPWLDTPRGTDLTKVRAYTETYDYDDVGGLAKLGHYAGPGSYVRTYGISPGSNQAASMTTGATTYSYAYDASGNLVRETASRLFEWNHANQLATFRNQTGGAEPSVHVQYRYDTAGQRVLKLVRKQGGHLAVTVYVAGLFERITLSDTAGVSSHDALHIRDGATRVAITRTGPPLPGDASPPVSYHLGDHLGSSTVVLDRTGALFNREEYTPYGETSFGSFPRKRYRHAAKERDEESGFSYHGFRYYLPWLARWASSDPIGLRDGLNPYGYVRNSPLRNTDPAGLQHQDAGTQPPQPAMTGTQADTADAGMSDAGPPGTASGGTASDSPSPAADESFVKDPVAGYRSAPAAHAPADGPAADQGRPAASPAPGQAPAQQPKAAREVRDAGRFFVGIALNDSASSKFLGTTYANVTANPGHAIAYTKDSSGKMDVVSIGPTRTITDQNAYDFFTGKLPATPLYHVKATDTYNVYEWQVNEPAYQKCVAAINAIKADAGMYTQDHQCTSAAIDVVRTGGMSLPSGKGKVTGYGMPAGITLPNPYHLDQQLRGTGLVPRPVTGDYFTGYLQVLRDAGR